MSSTRLPLATHIALGRNRWLVALLAEMSASNGCRFVELLHRLGASKDGLLHALQEAQVNGWVVRNVGYGHPLRPEYLLSDAGRDVADSVSMLHATMRALALNAHDLTRWSMPIIHVVGAGEQRFNGIKRMLVPATSRAISQGLGVLGAHELVTRATGQVDPSVGVYSLTDNGARLYDAA